MQSAKLLINKRYVMAHTASYIVHLVLMLECVLDFALATGKALHRRQLPPYTQVSQIPCSNSLVGQGQPRFTCKHDFC